MFMGAVAIVALLAAIAVPPAVLLSSSVTHAGTTRSRWLALAGFAWLFMGFVGVVYVVGQSAS